MLCNQMTASVNAKEEAKKAKKQASEDMKSGNLFGALIFAYSDEDNQCSGLIVISVPGWCDQSSERSDAGFCIL